MSRSSTGPTSDMTEYSRISGIPAIPSLTPEHLERIGRSRRTLECWLVRGVMVIFVLAWSAIVRAGLLAVISNLKLHH
jgi:hypothetical protein